MVGHASLIKHGNVDALTTLKEHFVKQVRYLMLFSNHPLPKTEVQNLFRRVLCDFTSYFLVGRQSARS